MPRKKSRPAKAVYLPEKPVRPKGALKSVVLPFGIGGMVKVRAGGRTYKGVVKQLPSGDVVVEIQVPKKTQKKKPKGTRRNGGYGFYWW